MSDEHQRYLAKKYFPGLNGVRAVAIIAVVWHHTATLDVLPMMTRGFLGVDLFFILSGFLISTLLLREKARTGRISLRDFWMRRVLRLVPVYYLLLASVLAAYVIFKPGSEETQRMIDGFPVYALYLSNWIDAGNDNLGITWSLATEEQFYLVWPLFEAFAAPIVAAGGWVIALVVNQLINFGVLDGTIESVFGLAPRDHPEILEATFTPILLGVGLAHLLNRAYWFDKARRLAGFRHAPAVIAGALIIILNIPQNDISGALRAAIHIVMTAWIASLLVRPASSVVKALEWRPVAFVGVVSYGMYLFHMFCIHFVREALDLAQLPQTNLQFVVALAVTIAAAGASYYLVEKKFLDLRKKFRP